MHDDHLTPSRSLPGAQNLRGANPADGAGDADSDDGRDDHDDDAVMAADDTGMLAGERLITQAELVEGNSGAADDVPRHAPAAGDV